LSDPLSWVVFRLGLSGKADDCTIFRQLFLSISKKVNHLAGINLLDVVCIIDGHFKPKVEPHNEPIDGLEVLFQGVVDRLQDVALPNHNRAVVAVLVVLLACQISTSQSRKLALIFEKGIQAPSNDHIKVDVELFALNIKIEECDLAPPLFPSLLQLLRLYVFIKPRWIIGKAVKGNVPRCVALDTCIEFINIICWVSVSPFH
jgi:hypothetical protein